MDEDDEIKELGVKVEDDTLLDEYNLEEPESMVEETEDVLPKEKVEIIKLVDESGLEETGSMVEHEEVLS